MSEIRVPGDTRLFFNHFAAYGLAAILEAELGTTVSVGMDSLQSVLVRTDSDHGPLQIASVVREHAARRLTSWVTRTHTHMGRETGTLSPRIKAPTAQDHWQELQTARHEAIDSIGSGPVSRLDLMLVGALGEPAYWYVDNTGKPQPDRGASGWEMKTRNRGEEFVQNRLALLCRAVSERSDMEVLDGLTGKSSVDEAGKNAVNSRTPTGLARPGPTDNALAWCALWGISLFPVSHDATIGPGTTRGSGRHSVTAGVLRGLPKLHHMARAVVYLPLFQGPLPLARLRTIVASAALARVATAQALELSRSAWTTKDRQRWDGMASALRRPADLAWLERKGVEAVMLSHIEASDNPNAPELHVAGGRMFPLEEMAI